MELYQKINLPQIPLEFFSFRYLTPVYGTLNTLKSMDYGLQHTKAGQVLSVTDQQIWNITHPDYTDWITRHLPIGSNHKLVCWSSLNGEPSCLPIHSDRTGTITLNYMVSSGGENVTTNWYHENNKNLVRKEKTIGNQSDSGVVLYDNCMLVESAIFNEGEWVCLRVDVLHDVQNITRTRCVWSIRFTDVNMFQVLKSL